MTSAERMGPLTARIWRHASGIIANARNFLSAARNHNLEVRVETPLGDRGILRSIEFYPVAEQAQAKLSQDTYGLFLTGPREGIVSRLQTGGLPLESYTKVHSPDGTPVYVRPTENIDQMGFPILERMTQEHYARAVKKDLSKGEDFLDGVLKSIRIRVTSDQIYQTYQQFQAIEQELIDLKASKKARTLGFIDEQGNRSRKYFKDDALYDASKVDSALSEISEKLGRLREAAKQRGMKDINKLEKIVDSNSIMVWAELTEGQKLLQKVYSSKRTGNDRWSAGAMYESEKVDRLRTSYDTNSAKLLESKFQAGKALLAETNSTGMFHELRTQGFHHVHIPVDLLRTRIVYGVGPKNDPTALFEPQEYVALRTKLNTANPTL